MPLGFKLLSIVFHEIRARSWFESRLGSQDIKAQLSGWAFCVSKAYIEVIALDMDF